MALNIKNEETEKVVRELAAVTGESQAQAVLVAARERLERVTAHDRAALMRQRVARLQAAYRASGADIDETMLYDERGMPR